MVIACGSDDSNYSRSDEALDNAMTARATIDTDNVKDLAVAATAGISASIANEAKPKPTLLNEFLIDLPGSWSYSESSASRSVEEEYQDVCNSGTSSITYNPDFTQFITRQKQVS